MCALVGLHEAHHGFISTLEPKKQAKIRLGSVASLQDVYFCNRLSVCASNICLLRPTLI